MDCFSDRVILNWFSYQSIVMLDNSLASLDKVLPLTLIRYDPSPRLTRALIHMNLRFHEHGSLHSI